eukprot:TRINITY_DN28348_c0_g1_i1.p1 TRINITY_DN28348_c0_g1~~TRINITY_DN28348_c0_g1_i1.p1  ORF type:complete len:211 (-),score=34.95 TRINITY_DN28348_c0_g1_i1:14-646(-)
MAVNAVSAAPFPGLELPDVVFSAAAPSPLASPSPSALGMAPLTSPVGQPMQTPQGVATTTWRTTVCPQLVKRTALRPVGSPTSAGLLTPMDSWPSPAFGASGTSPCFFPAEATAKVSAFAPVAASASAGAPAAFHVASASSATTAPAPLDSDFGSVPAAWAAAPPLLTPPVRRVAMAAASGTPVEKAPRLDEASVHGGRTRSLFEPGVVA